MTLLDVVFIAVVQALAEVLPLGGSGHLTLFGFAAGDARTTVVVAADVGVVAALMLYFWRELFAMGRSVIKLAKGRMDPGGRLLLQVLAGTLPALALTVAFVELGGGAAGRTATAAATAVFGLFLLAADRLGVTVRRVEHMGWAGAAAIGVLQAAAAIPGVSRIGVVITAARLMGYERAAAARFALLLAIPGIAGDAVLAFWQASQQAQMILSLDLAMVAGLAGATALAVVALLMAWIERHTFAPFAVWRLAFGLGVLGFALIR